MRLYHFFGYPSISGSLIFFRDSDSRRINKWRIPYHYGGILFDQKQPVKEENADMDGRRG